MTSTPGPVGRREFLQAGLAASLAFALPATAPAQARTAVLDDAARTWLKLVADLSGRTVASITEGMVWGFKPQADDLTLEAFARRLYGYRSLILRTAKASADGSVALTTQGWSFYTDAASGEIVDTLTNPYTGLQVSCPPLSVPASTTVYQRPETAGPASLDLKRRSLGEHAFVEVTRLSRFKPADTTWFKLEADLTTYACRGADLDRAGATHTPSTWSHNLVAEWQTWMRMHGEPGHILFIGQGAPLRDGRDLPEALFAGVARRFPDSAPALAAWRSGKAG